ncbi:hypothetical protein Nepgr_017498 [Nepenthes gracilis]|uniref:Uncharacterized protein n=1 Tax=Nepenthes gracilis TaxID=150966 RepID=A0AAD3XS77_NEPGR|nr:hypothetical protein Nepgr_017498 [Nepenthes gracilis]
MEAVAEPIRSPKNLDPGVKDSYQVDIDIEQQLDPPCEKSSCLSRLDPGAALGEILTYATCPNQVTDAVSLELVVDVQKVVLQPDDKVEKSTVSDKDVLLRAQFVGEH